MKTAKKFLVCFGQSFSFRDTARSLNELNWKLAVESLQSAETED